MTVTLNCLRGYPASTSDLQILHSLSQCNITSSALFQMSGSDKNSLCDCVCVCVCMFKVMVTYKCAFVYEDYSEPKICRVPSSGFVSRVLDKPEFVICLAVSLNVYPFV